MPFDKPNEEWDGSNFIRSFGKQGGGFVPPKVEEVERSPDRRPSGSPYYLVDRGKEMLFVLEVRGLGYMVVAAQGDETGKMRVSNGIYTVSRDMAVFGAEVEEGFPK